MIDWLFRDRTTGRIVVAQRPNVSLAVFLVAVVVRRFADPAGTAGTVVGAIATIALLWWAADELVRGVNPFRRILGAAVATVTVAGLVVG